MCCEQLVCASCNGRVAEAGCPTCRASRADLHGGEQQAWSLPFLLLVAALVLLLVVVVQQSA
jgi:hypothetical protein